MSFSQKLVSGHNCFGNKIYVATNLRIFPCVMERRMTHGVISKNNKISLDEKIMRFNKDNIEECKYCEYRYNCFDCRSDNIDGKIDNKPWYCSYQPLKGQWFSEEEFLENLRKQEIIR